VSHTSNPSYSGGRDQEDRGSKPARANSLWGPISKKPITHTKKGQWSGSRYRPWGQVLAPHTKKELKQPVFIGKSRELQRTNSQKSSRIRWFHTQEPDGHTLTEIVWEHRKCSKTSKLLLWSKYNMIPKSGKYKNRKLQAKYHWRISTWKYQIKY
jgi:hypothetical protein